MYRIAMEDDLRVVTPIKLTNPPIGQNGRLVFFSKNS